MPDRIARNPVALGGRVANGVTKIQRPTTSQASNCISPSDTSLHNTFTPHVTSKQQCSQMYAPRLRSPTPALPSTMRTAPAHTALFARKSPRVLALTPGPVPVPLHPLRPTLAESRWVATFTVWSVDTLTSPHALRLGVLRGWSHALFPISHMLTVTSHSLTSVCL